eukprot:CAMPEP_0195580082 /NCGR_PEP_ID=MMETSP0814-20130614/16978_1 /TAXON_ID=97485 /ORGANISM="Prymnesium parvum, Strain Texoma1" /LENGTH=126 /DNA_ID=CAMNT_0040717079 /DNA_START=283 /DNA_END=660 /DNA_ORIENTATION=+
MSPSPSQGLCPIFPMSKMGTVFLLQQRMRTTRASDLMRTREESDMSGRVHAYNAFHNLVKVYLSTERRASRQARMSNCARFHAARIRAALTAKALLVPELPTNETEEYPTASLSALKRASLVECIA